MKRLMLAMLGLTALALAVALRAEEPAKPAEDKGSQLRDDVALRQQILARQFAEFEQSLLRLKQRLERSPKQEDRDRAVILAKALDKSQELSINTRFERFVDFLKTQKLTSLPDIEKATRQSTELAEYLREIIGLLREDTLAARRREERLRLEEIIRELEKLIQAQRQAEAQTRIGKTDPSELIPIQNKVTNRTGDLIKKMDGQGGEGADAKSKEGGKGDGKKGESKNVGNDPAKKGEGKNAGKDGDGKQGEAKGNEGAKGAQGNKSGEGQSGSKKGGEGGKEAGAKSSKGGDSKAGGSKSGGQSSKQGEAKSGSSGQSSSKSGQQQSGSQQAGSKNSNNNKNANNNNNKSGPPQPDIAQSKKQVEDAEYKMKQAEDKIKQPDNKGASEDQIAAAKKLEEAKKKLEDLLRQLREEELERLLAQLQARCEKMLAMQMQVLAGTELVWGKIQAHKDKKADRFDQKDSLKLSDDEKDIVVEATKAIEMLEAEGSAVAFPEVFKQVREDMKNVQRRLGVVDAGVVTQAIERDIIDTLKEMIEALKKARQELNQNKSQSKPGQPPPNQDQKLLDQIAELKMIRSMQLRVNTRTKVYGEQYQGEQAGEGNIVRELRNLSERQERIFEVTNRIAKGDNK